jgi:hypothetical protein
MSLTKRWIESEKMTGSDPLHEDFQDFIDDGYWCHYAGMPSPSAYEGGEDVDIG